jgi:choline kinase
MKVVMLAAGTGSRLGFTGSENLPKVLLRIGGKTLLERHFEIFRRQGVKEVVLGVGFNHHLIEQEIDALGAQNYVRTVFNENYEEGNIVTLWTLRDELDCGAPVLLMDADVLYDEEIFQRLINSNHENCFLLDQAFVPGDEPVKLCVRDGELIEFRKWLSAEFDYCGESVGFFKLSSDIIKKLIVQTELYLRQGRRLDAYEEAIRDLLLTSPRGTFKFEDVSAMPWLEIDFAADVERAKTEILPRILQAAASRKPAMMAG